MSNIILLIEDNDDDVLIIRRGLKKGKIGNNVHRVINGKEGLDYLLNNNETKVELILLDLNMEVMNGFDFLQERMKNDELKKIPTVVLTSSNRHEDIEKAYKLGANAYVEKPVEPKRFMEVLLSIEDFWVYIAQKP